MSFHRCAQGFRHNVAGQVEAGFVRSSAVSRLRRWLVAVVVAVVAIAGPASSTANAAGEPPVITSFGAMNPYGDWWVFMGTVEDDYPEACLVIFSHVLEGYYTSVNGDGSFAFVIELPPGTGGLASAQAVNGYFEWSNIVHDSVDNW